MSKRKVVKVDEYIVVLSGLDVEGVLFEQYGEDNDIVSEVPLEDDEPSSRKHNLPPRKQNARKNKRSMLFTDQHKNQSRMYANMIDITQSGPLPRSTSKPCWWCRHSFNTLPVGCPIKYHPPTHINAIDKSRFVEHLSSMNISPVDNSTDFFETEGLFCSLSCTKAYILDQLAKTESPKYKTSLGLISLLRFKMEGVKDTVSVSPSWKMLIEYGGPLNIQEYRSSVGFTEYVETTNLRRPYLFSSSQYFKEKKIRT